MANLSFSRPDRAWAKRIITAKFLVFDIFRYDPKRIRLREQFYSTEQNYLGTSNFNIESFKIPLHEILRTIFRHTVCHPTYREPDLYFAGSISQQKGFVSNGIATSDLLMYPLICT